MEQQFYFRIQSWDKEIFGTQWQIIQIVTELHLLSERYHSRRVHPQSNPPRRSGKCVAYYPCRCGNKLKINILIFGH